MLLKLRRGLFLSSQFRMKILLVDDDKLFSHLVKVKLTEHRYTVDTAADGKEGWEFAETGDYDLIVLDVMLPKLDGISFCRKVRQANLQVLVLLLTARGTSDDKIMGLDAGADDYVVKPIPLLELEARIRALLRRQATTLSSVIEWGNLRLDLGQCEVTYNSVALSLTAKEHALIELLMRNPQKIHSQNSILNQLWSLDDEPPGGDTVRTLIKRLRQKLKAVGATDLIETIYGLGYRLNPVFQKSVSTSLSKEITSKVSSQRQISVNFWEDTKSEIIKQISLLEKLTDEKVTDDTLTVEQATAEVPQESQNNILKNAKQEAHKLIGSLGILGIPQAAEIARQIERLLQPKISNKLGQEIFLNESLSKSLREQVETLRLLVEDATPQSLAKQTTSETIAVENKQTQIEAQTRLLIIDEDREFTENLVTEATTLGMQTAIAASPQQALEAIARVRPDIVLMDIPVINTPTDALMFLDELSKQIPPIPVLVLTSDGKITKRGTIARRRVRGFLQKPITSSKVLEAVNQTLKPPKKPEAKVIVLDDDRLILRLVRTLLEPWGLQVTTLNNSTEFWDELEKVEPDLLIMDVQMPDVDGIELCQMIRDNSRWAPLPILFLTGDRNTDTIQQIFAAGADDYISKPVVAPELITRIFNRLERTRLLKEQSEIDLLTGLPNRRSSNQDLDRLLNLASQHQQALNLAVVTLDHLNQINRKHGHRFGDQMLRRFGNLLRQELRSEDIVARWDGAEFIVGMYGISRENAVEWLKEILDILRKIEFPTSEAQFIYVTFSAGVAQYPKDASDIYTLYQAAGANLEKARDAGGNSVL
jgi:diguanylate cyclase (GGDEF)-like protein